MARLAVFAAISCLVLVGCGTAQGRRQIHQAGGSGDSSDYDYNVEVCYSALDVLGALNATDGNLTVFAEALYATGLVDVLEDAEIPATIFAPTDAAFEAVAAKMGMSLDDLLNSPTLIPILLYHILSQPVLTEELSSTSVLPTALGQYLNVSIDSSNTVDPVMLKATNSSADIIDGDYCNCEYCNIVVNVIDNVLLPDIINTTTNGTETLIVIGNEYGTIQDFLVVTEDLSPTVAPATSAATPSTSSTNSSSSSTGIAAAPAASRTGGITTSSGTYYTNSGANS